MYFTNKYHFVLQVELVICITFQMDTNTKRQIVSLYLMLPSVYVSDCYCEVFSDCFSVLSPSQRSHHLPCKLHGATALSVRTYADKAASKIKTCKSYRLVSLTARSLVNFSRMLVSTFGRRCNLMQQVL